MHNGLLNLSIWGDVLFALIVTHITIAAVTIFLHRQQSHHALDLHFTISHFLRFWLWLSTGTVTREWVAVHRKHHARCETPDDPHSPQVRGISKVLFQGYELYRLEAGNTETLEAYGRGTPDDWIERKLYAKHPHIGLAIMLAIDILLLGPLGLTVWAVQMLWIPFFAAGVINGAGHYWGYRSFVLNDASRNIIPWGILVGGEELHNNHHANAASARLSNRWWELDIGWLYIRALAAFGLATVRRVAPRLKSAKVKLNCDADNLRAVCTHRYQVLGQYARLLKRTVAKEIRKAANARLIPERMQASARRALRCWLQGTAGSLSPAECDALALAFRSSVVLQTIDSMRRDLSALWSRSTNTPTQLVSQLEEWCQRAEKSGIGGLSTFSQRLRGYRCSLE